VAAVAFRTEILISAVSDIAVDVVDVDGCHCDSYLGTVTAEGFGT
jgi:hypothetical protein